MTGIIPEINGIFVIRQQNSFTTFRVIPRPNEHATQMIFTRATNGVETNFGVVVGEAKPEGPRAGNEVLGEGQSAPPQTISSPSGVRGGAPAGEGFSCILCRQIAFPNISVRVAWLGIRFF